LLAVANIIPMENGNGSKVGAYNAAIAELVEERANAGKRVIFVDNHAAFTSNANYASQWMSDALHPNTAGYVPLGDSYYDAIAKYLLDN
jgi:lysophospholipase L1-like esterase